MRKTDEIRRLFIHGRGIDAKVSGMKDEAFRGFQRQTRPINNAVIHANVFHFEWTDLMDFSWYDGLQVGMLRQDVFFQFFPE